MNDSELERKLKTVPIPERSAEYWEAFSQTVISRLNRPARPAQGPFGRQPRFAWALGLACVCLLVALGYWHNRPSSPVSAGFMQNEKVIRETLAMFPNQVRAIVQDERGTRLVLSDKPDIPVSTPLWIKICNGTQCRVVITFSGQSLQIAKEKVEVLADAQGQVMLVGDQLFWSATGPTRAADHLRIQAKPLGLL